MTEKDSLKLLGDIRDKLELSTHEEFAYCNSAIRRADSVIHAINDGLASGDNSYQIIGRIYSALVHEMTGKGPSRPEVEVIEMTVDRCAQSLGKSEYYVVFSVSWDGNQSINSCAVSIDFNPLTVDGIDRLKDIISKRLNFGKDSKITIISTEKLGI